MNDRKKEIYELQYMLRKISQKTGEIPLINTDGIYGDKTRETVRAFQEQNSLPVTGKTDKATWDKIFEKYKDYVYASSRGEAVYFYPSPDYKVEYGERSDFVTVIQIILSYLSVIYDDFEDLKITGVYDEQTKEAVKRFQKYHGFESTGMLDKKTWDAAAKSFNLYQGRNGNYTYFSFGEK